MPEKYQALLIHGLGWDKSAKEYQELSEKASNEATSRTGVETTVVRFPRPNVYGRFVNSAAQALYRNGQVENIVVTGPKLFRHEKPFGEVLKREFQRNSGISDENLIKEGECVRTTSMELQVLAEQAKRHGWDNVASITLGIHQKRADIIAKKISKKEGIKITTLAAENILCSPEQVGETRAAKYKQFFKKLQRSPKYIKFALYELLLARNIERTHTTALFDKLAKYIRPKIASS